MKINKPYFALMLVCLIWGTTYLVNKIGVGQIPSLLFSSVRQLIAGGIILGYFFIIKRKAFPDKTYLFRQMILGVLLIGGGNGIGTYGLQYIDSGISAILATTSPLLVALLVEWKNTEDRLNEKGWLGLLLGFSGLCLVMYEKVNIHQSSHVVLGLLLTILSVVLWSAGTVIGKSKNMQISPFISSGFQMIFGGIPIAIVSLLFESPMDYTFEWTHGVIWLYLIVFGSLIAYSSFVYCLDHLPVTIVSLHTYVNPILAVILGAVLLHEKMNGLIVLGATLTLLGVFLVNSGGLQKKLHT